MKYSFYFILSVLIAHGNSLFSQVNSFELNDHCDFIHQHESGQIFLSSTEGLYTHNGVRLNKISLDGLDEVNIQSSFFGESKDVLWFTTYKRIIRLNLRDFSYNAYPLTLPTGDTLNGDYYAFLYNPERKILFTKADSLVFQFNTATKTSIQYPVKIGGRRFLSSVDADTTYLCSYYYTSHPSITRLHTTSGRMLSSVPWNNWPNSLQARDMILLSPTSVLVATIKGLFFGDLHTGQIIPVQLPQSSDGNIECIGKYDEDHILVSTRNHGFFLLKTNYLPGVASYSPFLMHGLPAYANKIIQQQDRTIFISRYENGIYFFHPDKLKFENSSIGKVPFPVSKNSKESELIVHENYPSSEGSNCHGIENSKWKIETCLPFKYSMLFFPNGKSRRYPHPNDINLYRFFTGSSGNIYGSFLDGSIYRMAEDHPEKIITPWVKAKNFNFFYALDSTYHIASANNELLLIWNPLDTNALKIIRNFAGDIHNAVYAPKLQSIVLSTDQGLALLNKNTHEVTVHAPPSRTSCYCSLLDRDENVWYSSATQIHHFNTTTNQTHSYTFSDGVSENKYLERKCSMLSADSLIFYHEGGYTLIRPSAIKPIQNESKILLESFKIQDLVHTEPNLLNYDTALILPHRQNTFSFELYAVDWSDPSKTMLRYRLDGVDNDWVLVRENGYNARYPKLSPGNYTLLIQGANSDGIWNDEIKRISIRIIPPFWMKWWFLTMAALATIGIGYWIVRAYYQRKIEKKNQLLREQSLIIEKQQAIENERTRIASEMHDDLGSGLTTIRYLSDKALKQAKDESEASDIRRIADHSNALVRNMSEIIWAMNSRFDTTQSLTGYLRRYASEFLEQRNMPFDFLAAGENADAPIGGEKRRNLFLVFKEVLHNAVKYSNAKKVRIEIEANINFIIRIIEVGGIGFDPEVKMANGNGLYNCGKRISSIHGTIIFEKREDAMVTIISTPIDVAT